MFIQFSITSRKKIVFSKPRNTFVDDTNKSETAVRLALRIKLRKI